MKRKDNLTKESVRLEATARNPNNAPAIKAARTRFENAHRSYWDAVHAAWKDVKDGSSIADAAAKHEVDPLDIAEIAN